MFLQIRCRERFNFTSRRKNLTREHAVDPHKLGLHDRPDDQIIRVISSCAICLGYKVHCHIWAKNLVEDQQRYLEILNQENQILQECQTLNQAQVSIPGTWQQEALMKINRYIKGRIIREGREKVRKRRCGTPQQEFKEEQYQYRSNGSFNWSSYHNLVFNRFLYLYIELVHAQTSIPVMYLVKDNRPVHQTV